MGNELHGFEKSVADSLPKNEFNEFVAEILGKHCQMAGGNGGSGGAHCGVHATG